jgi:hypothetical protein
MPRPPRKKKEEPPQEEPRMFGQSSPHYIDVAVFLVLMIVASIIAYALIPVLFQEEGPDKSSEMADLATGTNQALMGSTVPSCVYTDTLQQRTEYLDEPVHYLLCEDMYIRTHGKVHLDQSSLVNGIEKNIGLLGGRLLPQGHGLVIRVSLGNGEFVILVEEKDGKPHVGVDPTDKVVTRILSSQNTRAFYVDSNYFLRTGEEVTVTFALFRSSSFDTGPVTGGAFA